MAVRSPHEQFRWTLHNHTARPRVVSHKTAQMPGAKGSGLRQAVVRIKSRQSLEKLTPEGKVFPGTGNIEDKTEYVVVQRMTIENQEQPWMIWGTVEESDWRQVVPNVN